MADAPEVVSSPIDNRPDRFPIPSQNVQKPSEATDLLPTGDASTSGRSSTLVAYTLKSDHDTLPPSYQSPTTTPQSLALTPQPPTPAPQPPTQAPQPPTQAPQPPMPAPRPGHLTQTNDEWQPWHTGFWDCCKPMNLCKSIAMR
jgi:hypothetical protein